MFRKAIITSGPTIEPLDPVRFISNRSSGKSGCFLANEARRRGIEEIIFITGPTSFIPRNVTLVQVETALQMRTQLFKYIEGTEVVIMAAAVSDYRPEEFSFQKIKKNRESLSLKLVKNPDILLELGKQKISSQIIVGYAAETNYTLENARKKFSTKNLDLLVVNEISEINPAFNIDHNQVYIISSEGEKRLEKMEKSSLAVCIWDEIFKIAKNKLGEKD